ncbi:MAG TPA: LysR substrate-binding domain-containing protein, partial [Hydrogenophaga sp.]
MKPTERNYARRIDLTSLQLFIAVCERGSIGKAAEQEFMATSAVSKRLSDLEDTVGSSLLYRSPRGVTPTPAGQSMLHHARSVLFSLEKMQGELSEYADGVRGHVRMHANISAIVQFLPEDLGTFTKAHDQIKIDLEEHLSAEVVRAVHEGAADLGICHHSPTDQPLDLQIRPYRRDTLALVMPCDHPLTRRTSIAFAESLDWDHVGLHANSS